MTEPTPGTPGSENTPQGDGPPSVADRATPGAPPPGSNQPKTEDIQPAQDATGEPGTVASADPQGRSVRGGVMVPEPGESSAQTPERSGGFAPGPAPEGAVADDDTAGAATMDATTGAAPGGPTPQAVPSPGDSAGVSVPAVQSAAGTSQDSDAVSGVRATAIAPPTKPDGEVDTRT